ncbi:MAG: phytanoyl-CoA dioxygenase family protein [Panacagrimonas sp.]
MSLNAEQIALYQEQGLLVIDPQIPLATLDAVRADLGPRFPAEPASALFKDRGTVVGYNRIQDAWKISAAVREIALAPVVHAALESLYGRRPLPFQTLNFLRGTEQRVHADTIHFNSEPRGFMCGVWVALEDVDMDNGPLVYYPGSHRLPELSLRDLGPEVGRLMKRLPLPRMDVHRAIYAPYYEPYIESWIAQHRLSPQYGTVRRGQAIVWAANLLHGGSPQRDRGRTRWSQVTHFYFDGCRYFTPLNERRGLFGKPATSWRRPRRIRSS